MKSNEFKFLSQSVHEIELHYKRPLLEKLEAISNSEEANTYFRRFINPQRIDLKEFFWTIYLSNSNHVLGIAEIGSGTITGVRVNVKEIFQIALITNASAIILAHNHPSGKLKSSLADKAITGKIEEIGKTLNVKIVDHLILTSESYYSFQDGGLLQDLIIS